MGVELRKDLEVAVEPEFGYMKERGSGDRNIVSVMSQILIAVALYEICYYLFYRQANSCQGDLGTYISDLTAHIRYGIDGIGYSLLYKVIGFFVKHFGTSGVAALESSMIVLTWYFGKRLIDRIAGYRSIVSIYASLGLIFLAAIHVQGRNYFMYEEFVVTQPWHNITFIGMRLLAILTIYYFIDLYRNYQSETIRKNYILVSGFLFLSAYVKPNFFISFSFALLIVIVIDFLGDPERFKNFRKYFMLGSTVFPACVILYIQSLDLYPSGLEGDAGTETSGVAITWFRGILGCSLGHVLINVFLSLAFPIIVFVFNKGGDKVSRYICLLYVVSFGVANLFQETGPRQYHGNFFWGMFCAGYLLFLFAISLFIKNWKERVPRGSKASIVYKAAGTVLFVCHALSGFGYFRLLLRGAYFGV